MNVLVACEESQRVTTEFRRLGHNAFSCDIIDQSGGHPEWHIMQDVIPFGVMSSVWQKPTQIIQPYQFGEPVEKKTCLWLKGVKKLKSTEEVEPPPRVKFDSGKSMPKWYADAWKLPPSERAKFRSKTFPGIAKAMAEQWGHRLI